MMPWMQRTLVRAALAGVIIATTPMAALAQTAPLPEGIIQPGVFISGLDVSGLSTQDAKRKVLNDLVAGRRAPLALTFRGQALQINPDAVGYKAAVDAAVIAALQAVPVPGIPLDVPLEESITTSKLKDVLIWRAREDAIPALNATVRLGRGFRPVVTKAKVGYVIDIPRAVALLGPAFVTAHPATPYALPEKTVAPQTTSVGSVLVLVRREFKLRLYRGETRIRTYPVAVGQPAYPTPTGNYVVIVKQMHPTWFPPDSPWAAGLGPVPPGVSNPLGTRWIGTSAPAIGMHGTPVPSSIGSAASHGCIRMYMVDVEDLYPKVQIGTPVFIR